ncbi:MAG: histidine kinase [Chloroflexi bacterium GWB2_49_20]|nr:MAG: histidine kinase [Chloroflexi bacterium GWB2_49_20]OGN79981.1 MAG: histidine kinase [Chloroflexi bacterium GWC2_49_37]OGN85483.1 MAG: histidine kinase [Chloroflexi bacterium GWD2_49_16]HBG74351.1 histidine kinase [Anaerolineae bacterium]HCM97039.1 histidine kinase [Anaerolineae bacterium]
MKTIRQAIKEKDSEIWWTTPDTHVFNALSLMAEKSVGALLVIEKGKIVGVFSERDYARKVILKGKSSKDIYVREIMTTNVRFITPEQTCEQALALMTDKHIRHLPVLQDDQLIGIVSIGDLVKAVIDDQKKTIDKLEKYILANTSIT